MYTAIRCFEGAKMKATICYSAVTSDPSEEGNFDDHGYCVGAWKYSLFEEGVLEDAKIGEFDLEVGVAIRQARDLGICHPSNTGNLASGWFYSESRVEDYGTGEEVEYSLHLEGVTPFSQRRIYRWLNGQNIFSGELK
jgi:hypothetical protein